MGDWMCGCVHVSVVNVVQRDAHVDAAVYAYETDDVTAADENDHSDVW